MEDVSLVNKIPDNKIISIQNSEYTLFGSQKNKKRKDFWFSYHEQSYNSNYGWLAFLNEDKIFFNSTNQSPPSCKSDKHEGWFVSLNDMFAYDENNSRLSCKNGKVSTAINSYGGITSAGVYIPKSNSVGACSSGDSAVTFRSTSCGTEMYKGIYLKNTLIGGMTTFKDNIYISISGEKGSSNLDSKGNFKKTDNLITGKPGYKLDDSSSSAVNVEVKSHMRIQ